MPNTINPGTPIESTNVENLNDFLVKLPNNTNNLIKPRDVRDSIYTTWQSVVLKQTTVSSSSVKYIGIDDSNTKSKFLIGKKNFTNQSTLDDTLLNSDTDIFIFNSKGDSDSLNQDTKVTFLAGVDTSIYTDAPFIKATKIASPNTIHLNITNPSSDGVININSKTFITDTLNVNISNNTNPVSSYIGLDATGNIVKNDVQIFDAIVSYTGIDAIGVNDIGNVLLTEIGIGWIRIEFPSGSFTNRVIIPHFTVGEPVQSFRLDWQEVSNDGIDFQFTDLDGNAVNDFERCSITIKSYPI